MLNPMKMLQARIELDEAKSFETMINEFYKAADQIKEKLPEEPDLYYELIDIALAITAFREHMIAAVERNKR